MHRTFLFLLVVGLIIAALRHRGGWVSPSETSPTAPLAGANPAATAPALTNSAASRALAAGLDPGK